MADVNGLEILDPHDGGGLAHGVKAVCYFWPHPSAAIHRRWCYKDLVVGQIRGLEGVQQSEQNCGLCKVRDGKLGTKTGLDILDDRFGVFGAKRQKLAAW